MVLLALIVLVAFAFADGFSSFTTTNSGIASNEVSAVAVDYLGQLFIGTKDSGLSMLQGSEWTHFTTDNSGLASDRIKAVACDSSGRVFIGTDSGLSIMSSSGWQTFTTDNSDLTDNWVESLAVVPDGVVWVGTHSGGLCSYDGTTWEHFNTSNSGLASNRIASVTVGKDGAVWVGTSDAGVSVMSDDTWTTYNTGNSLLMSDNINSIGVCPSGAVWVGTPNGLCVFRNGEWENGTSLVFASNADGDFEIYALDLKSGEISKLTDNSWDDRSPVWNPNGLFIVYQSMERGNWNLMRLWMTPDRRVEELTSGAADEIRPRFSPDGKGVIFNTNSPGVRWELGYLDLITGLLSLIHI